MFTWIVICVKACPLFERAKQSFDCSLNNIYSRYGGSIDSIHSLKDAIVSQFRNFWLFLSVMFVCFSYVYVCKCVCLYVCACTYIYKYIYIYTRIEDE